MATKTEQLRTQLQAIGQRRERALAEAERALDEAIAIAPRARKAGISEREIAQLANVTRPTLTARLGERGR